MKRFSLIRLRRRLRVYPWMPALWRGLAFGGNAKIMSAFVRLWRTSARFLRSFSEGELRRIFTDRQATNLSADNLDEYAEIIKENFGISYPEKFLRNFRDFILRNRLPASGGRAIYKGESRYIKVPRACPWGSIILIFFLVFVRDNVSANNSLVKDKSALKPAVLYKNNTKEWHNRNDHLIPDERETRAILSLSQKRDFLSSDIDQDGVKNSLDPSIYDWREIGYQPFGVLAFFSWNHDWNNYKYSQDDLIKAVRLLKEAGVSFVRMDFLWEDIEPSKNNFNFNKYDFIVELLSKENIRILGIVGYSSSWAGKSWNSPPQDLADFLDFISQVVSHYKHKIKYWEIWNEPNSRAYWQPQDDMKTYTKLLKLCYIEAKKIDPSCKIVLGGMTSEGYYAINNVYRNGGRDFFDIINIHPFVNPLIPSELKRINAVYNNLEKLKEKYNDAHKKIWFTEIGCPGIGPKVESKGWWMGRSPSEKQQEKFLNYIYTDLIELPNLEKIFWAFFRDNKEHFKNDVDYFGLIRWDFSKKSAFEVYKKKFINWSDQYLSLPR